MFKSHVLPIVVIKQLNVTTTALSEYMSYKMTPGSKKRLQSKQQYIIYSKHGFNGLYRR
jgi:hypothetical protein